jgi:hypothetical protein
MPKLSTELATTFDAVSCSGVDTSVGVIAACAGRNAVDITTPTAASRYTTTELASANTANAANRITTTLPRSEHTITRRREWRSPSTPMNGAAIAAGIHRRSATRPTAAGPPWS